jgi:hypothetical protein
MVAHGHNPSYLGDGDGNNHSSKSTQAKTLAKPYLKKQTEKKQTSWA